MKPGFQILYMTAQIVYNFVQNIETCDNLLEKYKLQEEINNIYITLKKNEYFSFNSLMS